MSGGLCACSGRAPFWAGELAAQACPLSPPAPALRLQEQMEDMRKKEEHLEKEMLEVSVQNRRLAEPLQKAREEMSEMQKKLGDHERDKHLLVVRVACITSLLVSLWAQGRRASVRCLLRFMQGLALRAGGGLNLSFLRLETWGV